MKTFHPLLLLSTSILLLAACSKSELDEPTAQPDTNNAALLNEADHVGPSGQVTTDAGSDGILNNEADHVGTGGQVTPDADPGGTPHNAADLVGPGGQVTLDAESDGTGPGSAEAVNDPPCVFPLAPPANGPAPERGDGTPLTIPDLQD